MNSLARKRIHFGQSEFTLRENGFDLAEMNSLLRKRTRFGPGLVNSTYLRYCVRHIGRNNLLIGTLNGASNARHVVDLGSAVHAVPPGAVPAAALRALPAVEGIHRRARRPPSAGWASR